MDGSQRRRPWWHWVLGVFVDLVILSAIFGADGPDYTGLVQVVGDDHFDLDRDGDGIGCDC